MERLEIKKVYIDTRFKTADSKSDTDFAVELPKSFNLPDDVVCLYKRHSYSRVLGDSWR